MFLTYPINLFYYCRNDNEREIQLSESDERARGNKQQHRRQRQPDLVSQHSEKYSQLTVFSHQFNHNFLRSEIRLAAFTNVSASRAKSSLCGLAVETTIPARLP